VTEIAVHHLVEDVAAGLLHDVEGAEADHTLLPEEKEAVGTEAEGEMTGERTGEMTDKMTGTRIARKMGAATATVMEATIDGKIVMLAGATMIVETTATVTAATVNEATVRTIIMNGLTKKKRTIDMMIAMMIATMIVRTIAEEINF